MTMKLSKHTKLKLKVMRALQDDEERQLQKELLGALIDDSTPDEDDFQPAMRDAAQIPELPQGAVAALPEPEKKLAEEHVDAQDTQSEESTEASPGEEGASQEPNEGENQAA